MKLNAALRLFIPLPQGPCEVRAKAQTLFRAPVTLGGGKLTRAIHSPKTGEKLMEIATPATFVFQNRGGFAPELIGWHASN